jgi:hypothetical protein
MLVRIEFRSELYDALLPHVPRESPLHECLESAVKLPGLWHESSAEVMVTCDENRARLLLDIAAKHCRPAVPPIRRAIRSSHSPHAA